jgi:hypothetical protein
MTDLRPSPLLASLFPFHLNLSPTHSSTRTYYPRLPAPRTASAEPAAPAPGSPTASPAPPPAPAAALTASAPEPRPPTSNSSPLSHPHPTYPTRLLRNLTAAIQLTLARLTPPHGKGRGARTHGRRNARKEGPACILTPIRQESTHIRKKGEWGVELQCLRTRTHNGRNAVCACESRARQSAVDQP